MILLSLKLFLIDVKFEFRISCDSDVSVAEVIGILMSSSWWWVISWQTILTTMIFVYVHRWRFSILIGSRSHRLVFETVGNGKCFLLKRALRQRKAVHQLPSVKCWLSWHQIILNLFSFFHIGWKSFVWPVIFKIQLTVLGPF